MNGAEPLSLERAAGLFALFGDETRVRLLWLLTEAELSVAEICRVTELAQSRVSGHLARLRDGGLLSARARGASNLYRVDDEQLSPEGRALLAVFSERLRDSVLDGDRRRLAEALAARTGGETWPESIAGEMERHYSPGRTWEALGNALFGLLSLGDVLDVGCGDGHLAALLEGRCARYVGIDVSPKVIEAAARRVLGSAEGSAVAQQVRFEVGDMHALPLADASVDVALLLHVLGYSNEPSLPLREAARVLRPGGRVVVATLLEHPHAELTARYGHVNAGLQPIALQRLLERAGMTPQFCEITSRERRAPHFQVLTAIATK
jgi:ubiquinone/menaquinone biosynthesis C-methylase UbiE/DNA-binding transcriptional ArsR family regulator